MLLTLDRLLIAYVKRLLLRLSVGFVKIFVAFGPLLYLEKNHLRSLVNAFTTVPANSTIITNTPIG